MKNILVISRDKSILKEARTAVKQAGFHLVKKTPDAIALIDDEGSLTYKVLNEKSNQLFLVIEKNIHTQGRNE